MHIEFLNFFFIILEEMEKGDIGFFWLLLMVCKITVEISTNRAAKSSYQSWVCSAKNYLTVEYR